MRPAGIHWRRVLWAAGAPARLLLLGLIHLYRATFAHVLGGQCRFHPTCSRYALDSISTHGAARGSILAVWRVLRCNPYGSGGIEHTPPAGAWRRAFVRQRHTTPEAGMRREAA